MKTNLNSNNNAAAETVTRLAAPQFVSNTPENARPAIPKTRDLDDIGAFKQIIRDLGLKVTQQRITILRALKSGRAHVTAQEVFETISQDNPEIGFATVYRFLRALSENNFITEVRMGGLPARYEWADKDHHDHLTCVQCGTICEFENHKIEELQKQVAQQFGFQLTDHVLELYGICPACQLKAKQNN